MTTVFSRIDLLLYSLLILGTLFVHLKLNSKNQISTRIFELIILSLFIVVSIEVFTWASIGINRTLLTWSFNISLSISSMPTVLWFVYFDYKVYKDIKATLKRLKYYMLVPIFINVVMIMNYINPGFVYTLSDDVQIIFGIGSIIIPIITYIGVIFVIWFLHKGTSFTKDKVNKAILSFLIFPAIGSVIQMFLTGVSLNWPMYTFALLMNFIILERLELVKDPLTELPLRNRLEEELTFRLKRKVPFSLVLIDLDGFKMINDQYGHLEGDKVLKIVSNLLKDVTTNKDLVTRYGGDEFVIVLDHTSKTDLEKFSDLLKLLIEYENEKNSRYTINMSFGMHTIDDFEQLNADDLLSIVDARMYKEKQVKKQLRKAD